MKHKTYTDEYGETYIMPNAKFKKSVNEFIENNKELFESIEQRKLEIKMSKIRMNYHILHLLNLINKI